MKVEPLVVCLFLEHLLRHGSPGIHVAVGGSDAVAGGMDSRRQSLKRQLLVGELFRCDYYYLN
jgi:hypothetical protein